MSGRRVPPWADELPERQSSHDSAVGDKGELWSASRRLLVLDHSGSERLLGRWPNAVCDGATSGGSEGQTGQGGCSCFSGLQRCCGVDARVTTKGPECGVVGLLVIGLGRA
jgi:hypothetical protein